MADGIEFVISAVDNTASAFASSIGGMGKLGGAAAAASGAVAAAGTAVFTFTAVVANSIEKTKDFADKLGVPVEQLSTLQAAASAANIDTEVFNRSMIQLSQSATKAASGVKEDKKAFDQLGISVTQFRSLDINGQMDILATKLSGVKNGQDRLNIAVALFGERGTDMLKLLGQNKDALDEARKKAEFLGLAIGPQMAANAKAFGDGMDDATGAIKGVSMAVADEFMPLITGLMGKFSEALASHRAAIASFVKSAILSFFTFIEIVKQVFTGITKLFTDREAQTRFLKNLAELPEKVGVIFIAVGKAIFIGAWEGFKLLVDAIAVGVGSLSTMVANALTGRPIMQGVTDITDTLFRNFDAAKEKISGVMDEVTGVIKESATEIGTGLADMVGINVNVARANAQAAIDDLAVYGEAASEVIKASATSAKEEYNSAQTAGIEFAKSMSEWNSEFVVSFFSTMSEGITNLSNEMAKSVVEGASVIDGFRKVAKTMLTELVSAIIQMGIRWAITNLMISKSTAATNSSNAAEAVGLAWANGVASWAAAPWPINAYAPIFGAQMAASAGIGASMVNVAGARAEGGEVKRGSTYLVGERGAELFTPNRNGAIVPNNALGGGGGGVTIENVSIVMFPNATNADAVFRMNQSELSDLMQRPILDALNNLDTRGSQPNFATRAR